MNAQTDNELVEASRRGERGAFGQLVERFAQMVGAVSYAATRDRTLSEDITQDTFVTAWTELHRLRDASAVRPWLCRIARNLAHKARRVRVHEVALVDPDAFIAEHTPFDAARDAQVEQVVAAALERVPEPYREALVLFYYEQHSAKDVAVALGISEDVVHKRVSRGRKHLAAGVQQLVVDHLEQRRPRRDLAACVLALLPSALPVKGTPVMKLGLLAATTVIVGLGVNANAKQRHPRRPVTVTHAAPRAAPSTAAAPRLVTTALTCADAADYIISIAREGEESVFDEHPDRVRQTRQALERDCREEHWSSDAIDCALAADDMRHLHKCVAAFEKPERYAIAKLAGNDLSCATVGDHMARLIIGETHGTGQDTVVVSVLLDVNEMPAQLRDACSEEEWPETLRRCYADATLYGDTVICNVKYRR